MRKIQQAGFWLTTVACLLFSLSANASISQDQLKKRMIADLEFVKNVFEVKYAPRQWKADFAGWDLEKEIDSAKSKVMGLNQPTTKNFQIILKQFFNSAKDYHVGVRYFSTENATLPFTIKGADGRYFIVHIDRNKLPSRIFSAEIGDEILEFDNKPIHQVINQLREKEFGQNTFETDQELAELLLTNRKGDRGDVIPQGSVNIKIKNKQEKVLSYNLNWGYVPEKIRDFAKLGTQFKARTLELDPEKDSKLSIKDSSLFNKVMLASHWEKSEFIPKDNEENNYIIGSRKSYIPYLGTKTWQSNQEFAFHAYIYNNEEGKRIGYVRIPHYMADEEEADHFSQLIDFFNKNTDALVIDQINNPGGSVFYFYTLASMLTDKPLHAPKHRMALTQFEVYEAVSFLPILEMIYDDMTARFVLGDTIGGYPITYEVVPLMINFCKFVINEWNSGNLLTKPHYVYHVDEIKPHPQTRYTKPILVLVNSLDFSGGDFFPAILQDNKRAVIFGTRTSGAGGYVLSNEFPNQMGIKGFHMTGSIAERINHQPIENLGVTPDKEYKISVRDLKENYVEYVNAINAEVSALFK